MTPCGIDWTALRVVAVELEEGGCLGALVDPSPPGSGDILERAVDEHALGMRIVLALIVGQAAYLGMGREPFEMTAHEHIAMILLGVAYPHKCATTADGAAVEE